MAANSRHSPSWQRDPCPSWCVVRHQEDDHPDDRVHDSSPSYVPVVLNADDEVVSTELLIVMSRRVDETDDWVFVGEPDRARQRLVLTPESAQRVAHSVLEQLSPS